MPVSAWLSVVSLHLAPTAGCVLCAGCWSCLHPRWTPWGAPPGPSPHPRCDERGACCCGSLECRFLG